MLLIEAVFVTVKCWQEPEVAERQMRLDHGIAMEGAGGRVCGWWVYSNLNNAWIFSKGICNFNSQGNMEGYLQEQTSEIESYPKWKKSGYKFTHSIQYFLRQQTQTAYSLSLSECTGKTKNHIKLLIVVTFRAWNEMKKCTFSLSFLLSMILLFKICFHKIVFLIFKNKK